MNRPYQTIIPTVLKQKAYDLSYISPTWVEEEQEKKKRCVQQQNGGQGGLRNISWDNFLFCYSHLKLSNKRSFVGFLLENIQRD